MHDASAHPADDPQLHGSLGLQQDRQRRIVQADEGTVDERAFADELRPLERLAGDVQGRSGAISVRAKRDDLASPRAVHGLVAQGLDEQWSQFVDRRVVIQVQQDVARSAAAALGHGEGQLHLLASPCLGEYAVSQVPPTARAHPVDVVRCSRDSGARGECAMVERCERPW